MSAKTMSSITDENRDLRKQIGCMNGIFQIFDHHHVLTGRRLSGHHHKRRLQGAQYQVDPQYTTKAVMEKVLVEAHKGRSRISAESSRASYSSSSCSSTFSSLDFNSIAQPGTLPHRQENSPQSPFPLTPTKAPQSLDLRDVVKDSMYREACGLSTKPLAEDERRGTVMKHIDSPRPSTQQHRPKTPQPIISEGSTRVLGGVHKGMRYLSKDERLALPRFSFDGRESRDALKRAAKHKEVPRLSLDSKASSTISRLDFLARDPCTENENPCHNRTSSIVAKLMGLENFPDTIGADENRPHPNEAVFAQLFSTPQNQATYSPCVSQDNPASPSPRFHNATSVRKSNACSRFPIEPAPWRQQDFSQGSPKTDTRSRKAPTNNLKPSSSVYGEIEKRITELKFQKSGKDLRALKQILEAMHKTRDQLEDRTGDSNLSMWKDDRVYHQVPTMEEPCTPKQVGSSVVIIKPARVMDKARLPVLNQQGLQNSACRQKAKYVTSKDNNLRNSAPHKVKNCTRPGKGFGVASPRLQQNLLRIEGQSRPTTPSSYSGGAKKQCSGKIMEKSMKTRKHKVKAKDRQLSDDQLSEISSETRYSSYQNDTVSVVSESNNSQVSQTETEVTSLLHSIKIHAAQKKNSISATRERMPAIKINVVVSEQPSPISVLDETFYCEDSPSPVKKISIAFRDESSSPDEAEWHLENLNHSKDFTRSNHDHTLENFQTSVQELELLTEPDKTAMDHNTLNNRYINKILLTSGLLKDSSFISTTNQLHSSCHLINPDMFHVIEQTEGPNGEVSGKNDRMQLNNKTQRKLIFDMVDEILVRKVTPGRFFTSVAKKTSLQGLLKEVYLEMDRVCTIRTECNLDDEEDEMIRLLTADMTCQDDWVDYSGEVPALVLDIERLIFKELIKEVIMGYDRPLRHCSKLFSK